MKNIGLILNGVLAIALILLFLNVSTLEKQIANTVTDTGEKVDTNAYISNNLKIAYVNTDSLWTNYKYVQDMQSDLAGQKLQYEGRYNSEVKAFEKEYLAAQEQASRMTPQQGQALEAQLMQKQQSVLELEQNLNRKYMASEKTKTDKVHQTINTFLKGYGLENDWDYILGYGFMGSLLYGDTVNNITTDVLTKINEAYELESSTQEVEK